MNETTKKETLNGLRIGAIIAGAVIVAFIIGLFIAGTFNFGHRNTAQAENPTTSIDSKYPLITGEGTSPFVKVVDAVIPAVVNISAEKVVKITSPSFSWPFDDFFRDFFKDLPKTESKPQEQKTQTLGSGVIISADGYILTNNHVVAGFDNFVVKLSDKTEFKGKKVKIVGKDSKTDLAVIKVDTKENLPFAKMGNSDNIRVGDWAIAIGIPFGLEGTVTVGVISAKGRSGVPLPEGPTYQDFIQTDAAINPGNSGGPLVNIKGELIGINTAIRTTTGGNIGIGFATPINLAREISDQLISKGKIIRGYLGVYPQEITKELKDAMNLKTTEGVLLGEVVDNMPAAKAGLKAGDVVVKFDGKKVTDLQQFRRMVAEVAPGATVDIDVIRDGKSMTFNAKLQEMPDEVASKPEEIEKESNEITSWLGITVRNLTTDEKQSLNLEQGVMVDNIEGGSIADQSGIRQGDVLLKIDKYEISNIKDFSKLAKQLKDTKKPILFRLKRDKVSLFIAVTPE
jgi:Do/DeqQ family serine protease